MFFNYFLAFILPSLFGVYVYVILGGKKTVLHIIGVTITMMLIINNFLYFVLIYVRNLTSWNVYEDTSLTFKYSMFSIILAVVLSHVFRFIELHVKYKLKVEKND
ncbi:MAG: hypothetical protein LPK00_13880 [Bacillaceae bacterium]|nr:hypothetical protein [Bacillaceae bacterium]